MVYIVKTLSFLSLKGLWSFCQARPYINQGRRSIVTLDINILNPLWYTQKRLCYVIQWPLET
uniref:Uncharacterized protein n=1 Tax=Lepeophtheirus salmonis TaxID=72036 RepID=A0A0K2UFS0_LEPSM